MRLLTSLLVLALLLPVIIYKLSYLSAASATPEEVRKNVSNGKALLIDLSESSDFAIPGAVRMTPELLLKWQSQKEIPDSLQGYPLYLICHSGITSARLQKHLSTLIPEGVYSVEGGKIRWFSKSGRPCMQKGSINPPPGDNPLPFQKTPFAEQILILITAYFLKPLYMLAALFVFFRLRKSLSEDLIALRRSMFFFFFGEALCAVNYLAYGDTSILSEYLHMAGMVLAFAFAAFAFLTALEDRVFHMDASDETCVSLVLCGSCSKTPSTRCRFQTLLTWASAAMLILCFMPLCARPESVYYHTFVLGYWYLYDHPMIYQLFEWLAAPLIAFPLFLAALVFSVTKSPISFHRAKIFFTAGLGFWGFSMFRLVLAALYRQHLAWFFNWEEWTEALFVATVILLLWTFRKSLGLTGSNQKRAAGPVSAGG